MQRLRNRRHLRVQDICPGVYNTGGRQLYAEGRDLYERVLLLERARE